MITIGIIAMEIMAYLIFIKRLPVLPEVKHA
jgi:Ni/Fe-hydrogenase subunit HybB-like protein